jgi:hypothetical protein
MGRIRNHFFETEGIAVSLSSFRGIDAKVDKSGGRVRNSRDIEADRSPMGTKKLTQWGSNRPDTDGIHSSGKKDPQGSVLDFVGKVRCLAAFD